MVEVLTDVVKPPEEQKEKKHVLSITQTVGVDGMERLDFSIPLDLRITDHLLNELKFYVEDFRRFNKMENMKREQMTKKIVMPGNNPIKDKFNQMFHANKKN